MSFAFNFLPPDDDGTVIRNDATTSPVTQTGSEQAHQSDASSHQQLPSLRPFVWKEDVLPLLAERAQKEIVFTEIDIGPNHDNNPNVLPHETSDENHPKRHEPSRSSSSFASSSSLNMIRRVCLDEEGYDQTEVTPGVYEGGLQVWECSLDLVRYFHANHLQLHNSTMVSPENKKITALELGCGHGLPACWILREAMRNYCQTTATNEDPFPFRVIFVDYNYYVLDDATLTNIILNTADVMDPTKPEDITRLADAIQLGAGDWNDLSRQWQQGGNNRRVDWIVAAETTYTLQSAKDTARFLWHHLVPITGVAWIATKRYYFGVGGGTAAFRQATEEISSTCLDSDHALQVETVWVGDNGGGNIREILKVTMQQRHEINNQS